MFIRQVYYKYQTIMKRIIILFISALISTISIFANETPYEKKVRTICEKYYAYATYGFNVELSESERMQFALFGFEYPVYQALYEYAMKVNAQQAVIWSENFEKELDDAKSLMNEDDRYKIFMTSSYGKSMLYIKSILDEKYRKDDFETQKEYEIRVKDAIRNDFNKECINMVLLMNSSLKLEFIPKSYNPETRLYKVEVKESFLISDVKQIDHNYTTEINMQPNIARGYKGSKISPESIISVLWVIKDNEIYAGEIAYMNDLGELTKYTPNFQNTKQLEFEYDKLRDANSLLSGCVWKLSSLVNYVDVYMTELKTLCDIYNDSIKHNEYYNDTLYNKYLLSLATYYISDVNKYDEMDVKSVFIAQKNRLKTNYLTLLEEIEEDVRHNYPDKYISIYASHHSDFQEKCSNLRKSYKCYGYTDNQIAFYVIDDVKPNNPVCYDKYIRLFNNDDEYNLYYLDENKFKEEVEKREKIEKNYLAITRRLSEGKSLSFIGAKNNSKLEANIYISALEDSKIKMQWYTSLLDVYFIADTKMKKEYEKVGYLFENREKFFESYISGFYKDNLKKLKSLNR